METTTVVAPAVTEVTEEHHVARARQTAQALALAAGFSRAAASLVATSVSELARNLVLHATRGGSITVAAFRRDDGPSGNRLCLELTAEDDGPGIPDVELAMEDDYTTGGGLGGGLPGVKRMMDAFEITSAVGEGTRVTARMWEPGRNGNRKQG